MLNLFPARPEALIRQTCAAVAVVGVLLCLCAGVAQADERDHDRDRDREHGGRVYGQQIIEPGVARPYVDDYEGHHRHQFHHHIQKVEVVPAPQPVLVVPALDEVVHGILHLGM